MTPFVRFILTLLILGILLNLSIIIVANASGRARQQRDMAQEQERFEQIIQRYDKSLCRAEIAVEWQTIGESDRVSESCLIIRRLAESADAGPPQPLMNRVVIPGARVNIDGLTLEFSPLVPDQFKVLRDRTLRYFCQVYGESQPPEKRFRLLHSPDVPEVTRIHPEAPLPAFFEIRLWQYIWDLVPDSPPPPPEIPVGSLTPATGPSESSNRAAKNGIIVTWLKPDGRTIRNGRVYVATLGLEGVTLQEDTTGGLFQSIMSDAERYLPKSQSDGR